MKKRTLRLLVVTICIIAGVLFGAGAVNAAFFQTTYPNGIQHADDATLQTKYDTWKSWFYVAQNGYHRVNYPEGLACGANCASEGIGYGMLLAVWDGDQTAFNEFWNFKTTVSPRLNLMAWCVNGGGPVDQNSATDADVDIAMAMLLAHRRWGDAGAINYGSLATTEINKVAASDVCASSYNLYPGDYCSCVSNDNTYPSYFTPAWYTEFGAQTGNPTFWDGVKTKAYSMLSSSRNAATGLDTEQITYGGAAVSNLDGYNSARIPWRYSLDYIWNGTANSLAQITLDSTFFSGKASTCAAIYQINGTVSDGTYNGMRVGGAACSMMHAGMTTDLGLYYTQASATYNDSGHFYNSTLALLALVQMSGNCPKVFGNTPTPANTATGDLFDDCEDGDNQDMWGGFWYSYFDRGPLNYGTSYVVPNPVSWYTMAGMIPTPFWMQTGGGMGGTYAARMTGVVTTVYTYGFVGMGAGTNQNSGRMTFTSVDVSGYQGIRFKMKTALAGDMYDFKVTCGNRAVTSTGDNDWKYTFPGTTAMSVVTVPYSSFTQAVGWGIPTSWTIIAQHMTDVQWQSNGQPKAAIDLWVDDIEFYPAKPPTPTPTYCPGQLFDSLTDGNNVNEFGGYWYTYFDATSTVWPAASVTFTASAPGNGGVDFAARITGNVRNAAVSFVGMGSTLNPTNTLRNMSAFQGVTFWAQGDGNWYSVKIKAIPSINTGNNDWKYTFKSVNGTWTQYTIPFSIFSQEGGWGFVVPLATILSNMNGIQFESKGINHTVNLWVDDFVFNCTQNWTPTRTPIVGGTPTFTPVITNTYTRTSTPSLTNTVSPTFTRTVTPNITNTFTQTATGTFTRTMTVTPVNTSTFTLTQTSTFTRTNTPPANTPTFTPTFTMTATYSRTATPTFTRTASPSYTMTNTPIPPTSTFTSTPSRTVSPSYTMTNTPVPPTATFTATFTRTVTPSYTMTFTVTFTRTLTPVNSNTFTPTYTMTSTPIPPTATFTVTSTRTATSSYTVTNTPVPPTATFTVTFTRTATPSFTMTNTPVPPTATFTMTFTRTLTPVNTNTFTPTLTNTATSTFTRTVTPTYTRTVTPTWTPTTGPSFTVSPTAPGTFTSTPSSTPTSTRTPSFTVTSTYTATDTRTASPTGSSTQSSTPSFTPTFTRTLTGTATFTITRTFTPTFTNTATGTFTSTFTNTVTTGPSFTVSPTPPGTFTFSPTVTNTFTRTRTFTPTPTFTGTDTSTPVPPTATFTRTNTPTFTITRTDTPTFTYTLTPGPSFTDSPTAPGTFTFSPTVTNTFTRTRTNTPSQTFTATDTNTPFPPTSTRTRTYTNTPVPPTATNTAPDTFTMTATRTAVPPTATNTPPVPTATYTSTTMAIVTPGPGLVDDMADCNTGNLWGGYWYSYNDGGSVIWPASGAFVMSAPGVNGGADCAARMTGSVGAGGQIGMGTQLNANAGSGTVTDISACGGIQFYAKGDGNTYVVKVPYTDAGGANLTGWDDYKFTFTPPAGVWTLYTIPYASITQEGWGTIVLQSIVLANAKEFQFQTSGAPLASVDLWIDNLEVYGCPAATATPTPNPGMVDDMKDCNTQDLWGGYWYSYNDGGSVIWPAAGAFVMSAPGYEGAGDCAARMTGNVGAGGQIGMGLQLNKDAGTGVVTDISSCTGIKFYAFGDGNTYVMKVPYTDAGGANLTGWDDYKFTFTPPAGVWTLYTVPYASITQEGWGTIVLQSIVLANAKEFQFQTSGSPMASVDLWIDNIEVYGCTVPSPTPSVTPVLSATNTPVPPTATFTPIPPTSTRTITATGTFTRTATVTNTIVQSPTFTSTITRTGTPTFTVTQTATLVPGGSLIASITAPAIGVVGQQVTVIMNVTNNGTISIDTISPSALTVSAPAALNLFSGPTPASVATLASGAGTSFTWVYDVVGTAAGVTFSGSGDGFNSITSAPVSSGIVTGPAAGMDCLDPTATFTVTPTVTRTGTPTYTRTATFTFTRTVTPTPTYTVTVTFTYTATPSPTFTRTATLTITKTVTPTVLNTPTFTMTPTQVPDTQAVSDVKPYPNPVAPGTGTIVNFGFTLNRLDYDSIGIKIYTSASRLIRDTEVSKGDVSIVNDRILRYDSGKYLTGLSNGVYYYYLYAKKGGEITRSKIDKILILK